MAPNNFTTKLSRNTNRITVILVYAFLEWLLMFFIFLNSLFTYFIVKFASFFGLKQVCILCPKVDRIFEPSPENRFSYRDLLCRSHVAELASLSFCKTHGKLSESVNLLCSDCSDREERSNIGLGFCTCCQKSLAEKPYPSNYLLIKSSIWGKTLCDRDNGGLILEMIDDDKIGDLFETQRGSDPLGFFREKAGEGKRQEQQNGEVISDVESYGLSLREVSEEDGLRSVISNNFLGNEEDEIPEAKSRVSKDDDTGNAETNVEDEISGRVQEEEEEETEGADLLDDQLESKNEAFVIENLSVGFDPLLSGSQNEEEEEDDEEEEEEDEEETKELPETPTSVNTLLHKNEYAAAAEDAGDGSVVVASEMEGGDPLRTIERLRKTVKGEQEALRGLYAELEEERSASAIAANQTMAMITRLQEEKAKVQMEALQYQRMMEEQAEYDQEALQLLNHLMVKREKEKEELQRELEVYRQKVLDYESKAKNTRTDCEANEDDNDKKEENGEEDNSSEVDVDVDLEKITLDCVKHMSMLDDSLSEFEEERLVILDQLKVLEDRLLTMQENESKFPGEFSNSYDEEEEESYGNEGLTMASMAKSLLPLLDAAENESDDGFQELPESVENNNFGSESEKLEIIKQVDSVYERLQVLETDGEFLKNCMSSAKKGDKGTDLLQDILQHLRDLRNIELTETIENQTTQDE